MHLNSSECNEQQKYMNNKHQLYTDLIQEVYILLCEWWYKPDIDWTPESDWQGWSAEIVEYENIR